MYSLELLVMDGKTSKTCKVIFNKLENCASSWFYYRNRKMTMMINWGWRVDGTGLVSFTNSSTVFACQWWWTFLFHCRRLVSFIVRDGPRRRGSTGRLKFWLPLKSIFLKHFWPGTGLAKSFEGACPNCRFSFNCGNLSSLIHHVSDYSSDVLTPLIFWHPGQLWLTLRRLTSYIYMEHPFCADCAASLCVI